MRKPAAAISLAIHAVALLLLLSLTFTRVVPARFRDPIHIFLPPAPRAIAKAAGGGQRQPLPASHGAIPPATHRVWVPPMAVRQEHPQLILEAGVPDLDLRAGEIGDPLGRAGVLSGGIGGPLGIGDGPGVGVGPGPGSGAGGPARATPVKLSRHPQVIHMEEPEYSEEARKARFQGTVVLAIDVDASGRAVNIRVLHGLGLGLDEKAMQAVARWKFRPALSGDRPVMAPATVEVSFRLL